MQNKLQGPYGKPMEGYTLNSGTFKEDPFARTHIDILYIYLIIFINNSIILMLVIRTIKLSSNSIRRFRRLAKVRVGYGN